MVFIKTKSSCFWIDSTSVQDIRQELFLKKQTIIPSEALFYFNGKKVNNEDEILSSNSTLEIILPLIGGKGGFGSMLRALGAQIEKTTNTDACRDLSGRRLRDINEEERLRDWVSKQADRERESAEKKEAKLEKLRRIVKGENKHEFNDPEYEKQRESIAESVYDSIEAAMSANVTAGPSGVKRKASDDSNNSPIKRKGALFLGVDLTDSDLESSSDED